MGFLDNLRRALGGQGTPTAATRATDEPAAIRVPEITAVELLAERRNGAPPLLLDCREEWERRQGFIPDSQHIIMREIPGRLADLPRDAEIVVVCAHGNRSYSVAGYLIQQGFRARSLAGGTTGWQAQGGEIARNSQGQRG